MSEGNTHEMWDKSDQGDVILPKSIVNELSRQKDEGWGKARHFPDGGPRVTRRWAEGEARIRAGHK